MYAQNREIGRQGRQPHPSLINLENGFGPLGIIRDRAAVVISLLLTESGCGGFVRVIASGGLAGGRPALRNQPPLLLRILDLDVLDSLLDRSLLVLRGDIAKELAALSDQRDRHWYSRFFVVLLI
jgi:hypothetical protein